jgi:hypothetical protein
MRIAPLGNSCNLFELIDDLYGIACDALPVVIIKFDKSKITIRSNFIRYIAAIYKISGKRYKIYRSNLLRKVPLPFH